MSGGHYNYAFDSVDEMRCRLAEHLERNCGVEVAARWAASGVDHASIMQLRRRFLAHLALVSAAMQAIEWVDSGDMSNGSDFAALEAVFAESTSPPVTTTAPVTTTVVTVTITMTDDKWTADVSEIPDSKHVEVVSALLRVAQKAHFNDPLGP